MFTASATGAVVAQNRTYVRNPGFPRPYQESEDLVYTVTKSDKGEITIWGFAVLGNIQCSLY